MCEVWGRSHLTYTRSENASIGADTHPEYRIDASLIVNVNSLTNVNLWDFTVKFYLLVLIIILHLNLCEMFYFICLCVSLLYLNVQLFLL